VSDKKKQTQERVLARRTAAENRAAVAQRKRTKKVAQLAHREQIVQTALSRRYETPEDLFAKSGLDCRLQRVILKRGRKLVDSRHRAALTFLSGCTWLRNVEDWEPRGKSAGSLFKSLARHLLVKYTMPDFMFSVFFIEDKDVRNIAVDLFVKLGAGGSLVSAVKEGHLQVPLTKRMCHLFMQSPSNLGFLEAIRHTQVSVFGGDRRLANVIASSRLLRGIRPDEEFWSTVIQWVCAQPMLAPSQIHPIFDWIGRQRQEIQHFSMKGRTGLSVLRSVDEWHGELAREQKVHGHRYDPSGFKPWFADRKVRLPSGEHHIEEHCITEISTSKELAAEGRALRHCVYSYSWSVQRGGISIWSYRVDGERTLTLEVDNRTKRVVQCRGRANRPPTWSEMSQIERWMRENGLGRASHL
jgi:hypothetical protein